MDLLSKSLSDISPEEQGVRSEDANHESCTFGSASAADFSSGGNSQLNTNQNPVNQSVTTSPRFTSYVSLFTIFHLFSFTSNLPRTSHLTPRNSLSTTYPTLIFIIVLAFLSLSPNLASAQTLPVSAVTTLTPPYSVWLADYYAPGSNRFQSLITFRDFNEPSFDVKLRLKISSSSITIQTKPNFTPPAAITLLPGTPKQINATDLTTYFDWNNLDVSGIPRSQLIANGKLPEGQYSFCVEVLDYLTGKPIGRESCSSAYIQLKDQPLTIAPMCGAAVQPGQNLNIQFQWQNSGGLSPNSALSTQYQLTLFQVTVPGADPLTAIANNQVLQIYQSPFQNQSTLLYTQSNPALDLGEQYVWQVQAKDAKGFDSFKNDGKTTPCFFYFGYPTGGNIVINEPVDDFKFRKETLPYFKVTAPDNMLSSQQVIYTLKIVEMQAGQDTGAAMANNLPWKEEISQATSSTTGYDFLLQDSIPKTKRFAWKVIGKSGTQTVAESPIHTFYGPPLIEEFEAGNHVVKITKLDNQDLNSLKGEGYIRIAPGDSGKLDIAFDELDINKVAGKFVLNGGDIIHDISATANPIALKSKSDEVPDGTFYPTEIRLNKSKLAIVGTTKIPVPLSIDAVGVSYLMTAPSEFAFDNYKLKGSQFAAENINSFPLLDPLGFKVIYGPSSEIIVSDNEFIVNLDGVVALPSSVKQTDGSALEVSFEDYDNFHYGEFKPLNGAAIKLLDGTTLAAEPKEGFIDFSEDKSPGSKSGEADWTGIYVEKAMLDIPQDFDASGQLELRSGVLVNADVSNDYISAFNVDGTGLNFDVSFDSDDAVFGVINDFAGQFSAFDFQIVEGTVDKTEFEIDAILPFVSSSKLFTVEVPYETNGFGKAFFPEKISETVTFDKDDAQRKVEIKVHDLTFDDNGFVDAVIDYTNYYTDLALKNLKNFKISAQAETGFGDLGKPLALETPQTGSLGDIPIEVDSIAIVKVKDGHGAGVSASLNLGPATAGASGGVRAILASATLNGESATMVAAVAEGKAGIDTPLGGAKVSGVAGSATTFSANGFSNTNTAKAGLSVNAGVVNDVIKSANSVLGGLLKEQSLDYDAGVSQGTSASRSADGFKFQSYVVVDAVLVRAKGKIAMEQSDKWGAVMQGSVGLDGQLLEKIYSSLKAIEGQLMLGVKNSKPIMLVRGSADVKVGIVTPYIGLGNLGFAIGMHTAPSSFIPEDYTPAPQMDWSYSASTPFAAYYNVGISDAVPVVTGMVYELTMSEGVRAQGNIDFTKPVSLTDLQLCGGGIVKGGFMNISRGPLAMIMADKSVISVTGATDNCIGKKLESISKVKANMMITPIIPICAEGNAKMHFKASLDKINDPTAFANEFLYAVNFGSEQNPISVQPFCDPSLKVAKGWVNFSLGAGKVKLNYGLGIDINKRLEIPKIELGPNKDYIAPYFAFKTYLVGKTAVELGVGSITSPTLSAKLDLDVEGRFFTEAGVKYRLAGVENDLQLGMVNVGFKGRFNVEGNISPTAGVGGKLALEGDFDAAVGLLGKTYNVQHTGKIAIQ